MLAGPNFARLLPVAMLLGAAFLLAVDTLARSRAWRRRLAFSPPWLERRSSCGFSCEAAGPGDKVGVSTSRIFLKAGLLGWPKDGRTGKTGYRRRDRFGGGIVDNAGDNETSC
jgi:hypothetical protein